MRKALSLLGASAFRVHHILQQKSSGMNSFPVRLAVKLHNNWFPSQYKYVIENIILILKEIRLFGIFILRRSGLQ